MMHQKNLKVGKYFSVNDVRNLNWQVEFLKKKLTTFTHGRARDLKSHERPRAISIKRLLNTSSNN